MVRLMNLTNNQLFVDLVGKNKPEDIVTVPARDFLAVAINAKQRDRLAKEFGNKLHIKVA